MHSHTHRCTCLHVHTQTDDITHMYTFTPPLTVYTSLKEKMVSEILPYCTEVEEGGGGKGGKEREGRVGRKEGRENTTYQDCHMGL